MPDTWKGHREFRQSGKFGFVAYLSIERVVSILPPASGIVADSLQMAVTQRADPHSCPCGRNHQRADSLEMISITKHGAMCVQIAKLAAGPPPRESQGSRFNVAQTSGHGRAEGIWWKFGTTSRY